MKKESKFEKKIVTVSYNNMDEEKKDSQQMKVTKLDEECDETIEFCCTTTVPEGFKINDVNCVNICADFSELDCTLENREEKVWVDDPCDDGQIECPIVIQAVRLVGCARFLANVGPLEANLGVNENGCTVCCVTAVGVNQVIAFVCDETPPCSECFIIKNITLKKVTCDEDDCGRQVVTVMARAFVEFTGCDC